MALTRLPSFTLLSTDSYTFGNANVSGNVSAGNLKTDHLLYANGSAYSFFDGEYSSLANKPALFSGSYLDLTNTPTLFDGTYANLTGKPSFATVATSGSYNDLTNKPTIPDGTYANLTGKPTLGTAAATNANAYATAAQGTKADTAIQSGANISIFTNDSGYLVAANLSTYATQTYVTTAISNVIDSAPAALDTLKELANALGNDASYATTITNSLANKLAIGDFNSTANAWISTKTTSNLSEGTNLYYSDTRANTAIDNRVTKSFIDNLAVVSNIANIAYSVSVANVSGIGNIATINKDGNASNILYGNGIFAAAPSGGGGSTYGDSNVATYLPNYTGNLSPGKITIPVANLRVTGGTSGYVLRTDGTGNLSWVAQATGGGGGGGGASVTVSSTAPGVAAEGDLWLDSETGDLNVYFGGAWASVTESSPQFASIVNTFAGDSVTTDYVLSTTPVSKEYTLVAVGGLLQPRSVYDITGNVLSFSSAIPSNSPIEVTILGGYAAPIGAATVVTNNIQSNITEVGTLTVLNVSGNVTANKFIGDGSLLTNVALPPSATAGTVTNNAQPNITSVGTLLNLSVTGNITASNVTSGNLVTANYFSGNGHYLTDLLGTQISGEVAYANRANVAYSVSAANITGTITATTAGTVTTPAQANITSLGTLTGLTVSGNSVFNGWTTFQQSTENYTTKIGATGTVTHDLSTGGTFYHTSPAGNFTANFTNVPTTDLRIIVSSLVISQGASAYIPNAVQIDGSLQTIKWLGGVTPTGTNSKIDVFTFSLQRTGLSWVVFGQSVSYG